MTRSEQARLYDARRVILTVLYTLAGIVFALGATTDGLRYGLPAYKARQHHQCLVRTAVLEHELGIDLTNPELLPRPKVTPKAAADRWAASTSAAADNYSEGVRAYAEQFRRSGGTLGPRKVKREETSEYQRPQWRRY